MKKNINVNKIVGILGGMGPLSTAYFYKMIIDRTVAMSDKDHVDLVISSFASTPDRTEHILNSDAPSPVPHLVYSAQKLADFGAELIVMPCNTAHYFYDTLVSNIDVPFLSMIDETTKEIGRFGYKRVGILATEGTIHSSLYQDSLNSKSIKTVIPDRESQMIVNNTIYNGVKGNEGVNEADLNQVVNKLIDDGSEIIILGCTELSLIKERFFNNTNKFIDPLEILASRVIAFGEKIEASNK